MGAGSSALFQSPVDAVPHHHCCDLGALQGWWRVLVIVVGEKHLMIPLHEMAHEAGCGVFGIGVGHIGVDPIVVGVIVVATSPHTPYVPHKQRGLMVAVGGVVVVVPHCQCPGMSVSCC